MAEPNLVESVDAVVGLMNDILEEDQLSRSDVLDVLASTGLTLVPDIKGDAGVAYLMTVDPEAPL